VRLPRLIFFLFLCAITLPTPFLLSHAQTQRGQGVVSSQTSNGGRYYALLIGVQKYHDSGVLSLEFPLRDVEQMRQVLTAEYSFEPANVTVLKNPDRAVLMAAFEQLEKNLTAADHLLVFYAGHGQWEEQREQGYWLPSDAQRASRANWVSNSDLRDSIRGIKAKHTLLISDACFSGSLFVEAPRGAFDSRSAVIEEAQRKPSRAAMTSGALTTVPDKSVFVRFLVESLRENQESYLLAGDLFRQLLTPVINNSPRYLTVRAQYRNLVSFNKQVIKAVSLCL
jgi:hypothetical protein